MRILGIDHVEFYVHDIEQEVDRLCSAFGFHVVGTGGPETGLTGQRSVLVGNRGIRVLLTTGLDPEHPASRYVESHGDGVAVIAFGTDDAAATYTEVVRRGATALAEPVSYERGDARVVQATVSGFGDVVHRLIERHGPAEEFLPGAIALQPVVGDEDEPLLHKIDHAAICVPAGELEPTVTYYHDVFGFTEIFEEYIQVGGQAMESKVVQSPSGEVTFTLIEPDTTRRPGQIDDFLRWHNGAGVQHLALLTSDIAHAVSTASSHGMSFMSTPGSYYDELESRLGPIDVPVGTLRELNVLVDRDRWGQMYQIFAQSVHPRRTYFWELIERHGALTFGSGNIKALYEAKERELAAVSEVTGAPGELTGAGS